MTESTTAPCDFTRKIALISISGLQKYARFKTETETLSRIVKDQFLSTAPTLLTNSTTYLFNQ